MNRIIKNALVDFQEQIEMQIEDGKELEVHDFLLKVTQQASNLIKEEVDENPYYYHLECERDAYLANENQV